MLITMLMGAAADREQAIEEALEDFGNFVSEEGRQTSCEVEHEED
jgi:hypothetical protein